MIGLITTIAGGNLREFLFADELCWKKHWFDEYTSTKPKQVLKKLVD